jgi:hypothetical protein
MRTINHLIINLKGYKKKWEQKKIVEIFIGYDEKNENIKVQGNKMYFITKYLRSNL